MESSLDKTLPVKPKDESLFQKKWKIAKQRFLELSQDVQCECFPRIFEDAHYVKKFIWAILFLVFSALTIYLLTQNIISYYKYKYICFRILNNNIISLLFLYQKL